MSLTADMIMDAFNEATERGNWTAHMGQSRGVPTVKFSSRNTMVNLHYFLKEQRFAVTFNKLNASWGDYMVAIHRSLLVVATALKSAGLPFAAPTNPNDGKPVISFDPDTKMVFVTLQGMSDDWTTYEQPEDDFKDMHVEPALIYEQRAI